MLTGYVALLRNNHHMSPDAPSLVDSILISGGQLRFTSRGHSFYESRFARAGVRIETIRDIESLRFAVAVSFDQELDDAMKWLSQSQPFTDEYMLLAAVFAGNSEEAARYEARIAERPRLRIVRNEEEK